MKPCCQKEVALHLVKHLDIATCDECENLLLAYGNADDFESTCNELSHYETDFDTLITDSLWIISKKR